MESTLKYGKIQTEPDQITAGRRLKDPGNPLPLAEMEASTFRRGKKAEVFIANDLGLYTIVHRALKAGQIPYEVKIVNTGTRSRRADALIGRVGERPELEIQHYIYTPLEYADRVKYVIDEYRKNLFRQPRNP